jgi:Zn-dependent protease with chaperone function
MDFFQRQELARKQTRWLVLYFALAVAGTIATVYLVTALAFNYTSNSLGNEFNYVSLWDSQLFFGVTLATLAIIVCGSVYKITSLASGGAVVAASMGARFLAANTTQPDERRLLNVVEEMAIASGTPMPQVFVLDDSNTINAFAAGHSTNDMVICVTRGALRELPAMNSRASSVTNSATSSTATCASTSSSWATSSASSASP